MNKDLKALYNNLCKRYENSMTGGYKKDVRWHLIIMTQKEYDFMKNELLKLESEQYE